jgi:hypothetical protein
MAQLEDLCCWVDTLSQNAQSIACLDEVPEDIKSRLVHSSRLSDLLFDSNSKLDFILALDLALPEKEKDIFILFQKILGRLLPCASVLITAKLDHNITCDKINQFFAHTAGISIHAKAELIQPQWQCWLLQRNEGPLDLPIISGGWDLPLGDVMMRALNGSQPAYAHMKRYYLPTHPLKDHFHNALSQLKTHFEFECSGWTDVENDTCQLCLISGLVSTKDNQIKLRVSGTGATWIDAAFFMICEAIERIAQSYHPSSTLNGTAFGFTKESAILRAALENFERFYFYRTFTQPLNPLTKLDISQNKHLVELAQMLENVNGFKKLYLLTHTEPFYIVLALSIHNKGSEAHKYSYGLGCSFNLTDAAVKAMKESVQTSLYSESDYSNTDVDQNFMTFLGEKSHTSWKYLNHHQYETDLDTYAGYTLSPQQSETSLSDRQCFETLLNWCTEQNIEMNIENLFTPECEKEGWVVRAKLQ